VALTIAVLSQKGGTGKTTLTRSLADGLRRSGLETLAIDGDPQGNLSEYFGVAAEAYPTLGEVLTGRERALDAIHNGVIPANLGLAEAELILAGKIGRELTLRNALREPNRQYEVILIDCPPTLGLLTVNALVAADRAILSTEAEHFSEQGAEQAMEVINLARENLNPDLELLGILLNIADMRTRHARATLETLKGEFGDKVFETVIRRSIVYPESARAGQPIYEYNRRKALDYSRLTVEVLERLDLPGPLERARETLAELEPDSGKGPEPEPREETDTGTEAHEDPDPGPDAGRPVTNGYDPDGAPF
jgi:chromosome partitioning protein